MSLRSVAGPDLPHTDTIAEAAIVDPGANGRVECSTTHWVDATVNLSYILNVRVGQRGHQIGSAPASSPYGPEEQKPHQRVGLLSLGVQVVS